MRQVSEKLFRLVHASQAADLLAIFPSEPGAHRIEAIPGIAGERGLAAFLDRPSDRALAWWPRLAQPVQPACPGKWALAGQWRMWPAQLLAHVPPPAFLLFFSFSFCLFLF
jgi:hypothetical protein